jgi:nitrate/nitrite transporter NarK
VTAASGPSLLDFNEPRNRVLWLSTIAFTVLFAVWLMLGMLSIKIKPELGLSDGQFYNLTIAAILAGSLLRFNFGIWTDRYGGRLNQLATLLMAEVNVHFSYPLLTRPNGRAALAMHVDDSECAASVLQGEGFRLLSQRDISR